MSTVLWWVRRDLRLAGNPALKAALSAGAVVPVFVLDPRLLSRPAPARQSFLFDGLRALDSELRQHGSRLIVRSGQPKQALAHLLSETGAQAIFAEEDFTPFARRRDARVAAALPLRLIHGLTVHHPLAVLKKDGSPYTVFTPFSRAWKALPLPSIDLNPPAALPPIPEDLPSDDIPASQPSPLFPAGEAEALRRLDAFLTGPVTFYSEERDRVDLDGTSALSPYLRFGMLSALQAVRAAQQAADHAPDDLTRQGCAVWINELVWREFYQSILYHFPHVVKTAFNPALRAVPWRSDPAGLDAWQQGRTGYPVVDAAMRQMLVTGWMHNRARMIAASFLVKDLLVNWQSGEQWFMQQLIDGDPAANNGGWQWTAGTGTDAAPYFRVFSPISQGKKHDPRGDYVHRWVPELAAVPLEYLHEPWLMPAVVQQSCGCLIGRDYPAPIVDHAAARPRALAAYQSARQSRS